MVEKEFIEQINAFIAWLEELEAVTIASVEDTKVRIEFKHGVADLLLQFLLSESMPCY